MKIKILVLYVFLSALCFGQNQIYINQITTTGTTTIVQTGSVNKIGSSGTPSEITSDNLSFEMRQVGDNNEANFSMIGNNLTLKSITTGNSNNLKMFTNGANNDIDLTFTGNSNTFLLNKDAIANSTDKATTVNGDVKFVVTGSSNVMKVGIDDGKYNELDYTITGSSNTLTTTQAGNPSGNAAGSGHSQVVTVLGSSNTMTFQQAGLEKQTLTYNLTGSFNTVSIQQGTTAANLTPFP
jgi:hypothetical protein